VWARQRTSVVAAPPEHLAQTPFGPVASNRRPNSAGRDDSKTVAAERIRQAEHREMSRRDSPAALLDGCEFPTRTDSNAAAKFQRIHVVRSRSAAHPGAQPRSSISSGGNGQALATFGPPALQHNSTVLCVHPNQKTMSTPTTAAVRLIGTFHWAPGWVVTP